mgnify:CR=1 FL=1
MLKFDTSYSYDKVSLRIDLANYIHLERLPYFMHKLQISIGLYNVNDKCVFDESIEYSKSKVIKLPKVEEGCYYLNIFTNRVPYFQPRSISLEVNNNNWSFIESQIYYKNLEAIAKLKSDAKALAYYLRPTTLYNCTEKEIVTLAQKITMFSVTPMQKLLAIHDWVAENIYYDYDALADRSCDNEEYSAIEVLKSQKCVCRGYANLGVALMRAVGIPSFGQRCYALNISRDGGWDKPENQSARPNHIIAIAYVENRWVYMDITWDSDNRFEKGKFIKEPGQGISRKYFDTTLEMISNTHKFF